MLISPYFKIASAQTVLREPSAVNRFLF